MSEVAMLDASSQTVDSFTDEMLRVMPSCPQQIVQAVTHYGDCRADEVESGVALARVIVMVRWALHQERLKSGGVK